MRPAPPPSKAVLARYRSNWQGEVDSAAILKRLIANIGAALHHVRAAAEQFKTMDPWSCMLRYISDRIAPVIGPPRPPPGLPATG